MSFWVYLEEEGEPVTVDKFEDGGTRAVGGTDLAELNVTYNYGASFYEHLDGEKGLRVLNGQRAKDMLPKLKAAVAKLGDKPSGDYWASTPGNAGHALSILASWAEKHPNAVFRVS